MGGFVASHQPREMVTTLIASPDNCLLFTGDCLGYIKVRRRWSYHYADVAVGKVCVKWWCLYNLDIGPTLVYSEQHRKAANVFTVLYED